MNGWLSAGIRAAAALAALLSTTACGTGGTAQPADPTPLPASMEESGDQINLQLTRDERGVSAEYDAPADSLWRMLPAIYDELDIEPEIIDPRGRRYGSGSVSGTRVAGDPMYQLVRCGAQATGLQSTTRMRVTLSIITTVQPLGSTRSTATTRITGTGSRIDGTSTGSLACVSTGQLEERIAGMLRLAVASAAVTRE